MDEVTLQRFTVGISEFLTSECAAHFAEPPDVRVSDAVMFDRDLISVQLRQFVYGYQIDHVERTWPRDWWQALKERWFPPWATRRWPVVYDGVTIDAKVLYPQLAGADGVLNVTVHDAPPVEWEGADR